MGTIAASAVITRAATLLQDTANIRWSQAELLDYLNDGQREIAVFKPNSSVIRSNFYLAPGTRQTLPVNALILIDVTRNLGTNGDTPGDAIRVISREVLDAAYPNWHSPTNSSNKVKNYYYSVLDPKSFYVYPYQTGGTYIEVIFGAVPEAITSTAGGISVDDIFVPALVNYVLYRAYAKDSEFAANGAASQSYYQMFVTQVNGKASTEIAHSPNNSMAAYNPSAPGAK